MLTGLLRREISRSFAVIEYVRFLCAGGTMDGTFR